MKVQVHVLRPAQGVIGVSQKMPDSGGIHDLDRIGLHRETRGRGGRWGPGYIPPEIEILPQDPVRELLVCSLSDPADEPAPAGCEGDLGIVPGVQAAAISLDGPAPVGAGTARSPGLHCTLPVRGESPGLDKGYGPVGPEPAVFRGEDNTCGSCSHHDDIVGGVGPC